LNFKYPAPFRLGGAECLSPKNPSVPLHLTTLYIGVTLKVRGNPAPACLFRHLPL